MTQNKPKNIVFSDYVHAKKRPSQDDEEGPSRGTIADAAERIWAGEVVQVDVRYLQIVKLRRLIYYKRLRQQRARWAWFRFRCMAQAVLLALYLRLAVLAVDPM